MPVNRDRLAGLLERERQTFAERHPRSRAAYADGGAWLLGPDQVGERLVLGLLLRTRESLDRAPVAPPA